MFIGSDADALMFTSNRAPAGKKQQKNSSITGVPICNLYSTRKNATGQWEDTEPVEGLVNPDQAESSGGDSGGGGSGGSSGSDSGDGTDSGNAAKRAAPAEMGVCCFTADGKTMYFTYSKPINGSDQGSKIYSSTRASGTWSEPQEVKLFADSTISCGHPAITPNGDTLYFASDAPGGYGGKDLWLAEYTGDEWVGATNLGPIINTAGDELFPTLRQDGTLYFSSNGHQGYGGLDIFKAVRQDSLWLLFNMGTPLNSNADDFGMTFMSDKEAGFFSSNRNDRKGYDQIYSFILPEMEFAVEGRVSDIAGESVSEARLRIVGDDGTNAKVQVKRDGTYKFKLRKDANYVMLAAARGHLNQNQQLSTFNLRDSKTFTQDFSLAPISKPVTMDNIFYDFGKWTLRPESEEGLLQLVKMLGDNPNITIELAAHTDRVGQAEANQLLSDRRAQAVVDFLVMKGIERERLTPVGYGKTKPVVADKAIHDKYPFIPLEQELSEEFIDTLTPEQQDICNQINRRTEFKVLSTTYNLY